MDQLENIIVSFLGKVEIVQVEKLAGGLINQSFKVTIKDVVTTKTYFLQRINEKIFRDPDLLMRNIEALAQHLADCHYPYAVLRPLRVKGQAYHTDVRGKYWRMFNYIPATRSFEYATQLEQVQAAATAMGVFYQYTEGLKPNSMQKSIPHFHELDYYWEAFWKAVALNPLGRKKSLAALISKVKSQETLIERYRQLSLPQRILHGDPKLSNLLFSKTEMQVVAIIDWDTLMPGTILTDFGDIVRTYANVLGEESSNFVSIQLDIPYFEALVNAFLKTTATILHPEEVKNLYFGALWISLEQCLRFATDYLLGDIYYETIREEQNFVRAQNQLCFYLSLLAKEKEAEDFIKKQFAKYA